MPETRQNTREQILDITEKLITSKGYTNFSYTDIAKQVGIRKASIHYHFPAKEDLGSAYVQKYHQDFGKWCEQIAGFSDKDKLEKLYKLYRYLSRCGAHICPFGMLSTEYPILPGKIQQDIKHLYNELINWLTNVLASGKSQGIFKSYIEPRVMAAIIINAFSGALKMTRMFDNLEMLDQIYKEIQKMVLAD